MSRISATFSISLPPRMAAELERVRKREHRTRSELVREALRRYIHAAAMRNLKGRIGELAVEEPDAEEREAIMQGTAEFRLGRHAPFNRPHDELRSASRPSRAKKS